MRLIDADALINNLEMLILEQEEDDHVQTWNNAITCSINEVKHHTPTSLVDVKRKLVALPSIDAVKHGRWIPVDWAEPRRYGCSECHRMVWQLENYCPNCGARMDEGGNHETH